MSIKFITLLMIVLLLPSLVLADYLPHSKNQDLQVSFSDTGVTSCTVTSINNPNGTVSSLSVPLTASGSTFTGTISGSNFTRLGTACLIIECDSGYGSICREIVANDGLYLDFTNDFTVYTVLLFLIVCALVIFFVPMYKLYAGTIMFILGFILLFNSFNTYISLIVIAGGLLAILDGK
jgi:hypothetical protein